MSTDEIKKAAHYNQGGVECIVAIEASMSPTEFMGFLKGNVVKYLWRWREKGGVKDLEKAVYYLGMMPSRAPNPIEAAPPVLTAPALPQTKAPSPILNPIPLSPDPLRQPPIDWTDVPF